jgi:cytosine/adenosine deaminase-related metal-dependent hydrolase
VIINNANLVTRWASKPLVEGALLAIEGKTIVDFGPMGKLIDRYDDPDVFDAGGRLVVPGSIDAHSRLYRSFSCGMPHSGIHPRTPREYREQIWWPLENALDETRIYWSTLVSLLDAVRRGVTTVFAFHESPRSIEGSLDALARAFAEVGLRGSLAYGVSARSPAPGALKENARHIERSRAAANEMMTGLVGLQASTAVEEDVMRSTAEAAGRLGTGLHVCLTEGREELDACLAAYGSSTVARLDQNGVICGNGVLVHPEHLLGEDESLLRERGMRVVACPQVAALEAHGTADLQRLASRGVAATLGTDGLPGGLMEALRVAALRQREMGTDASDAIRLAHRAAFFESAELATSRFGRPLGRIRPGARADLVILDYWPATPLDEANAVHHLFWGVSQAAVHTVIVNGNVLYQNGCFLGLDEQRLRARAAEVARSTWEQI